jgi:hypothetical protein
VGEQDIEPQRSPHAIKNAGANIRSNA